MDSKASKRVRVTRIREGRLAACKNSLHAGRKLFRIEGLGHVIVGPEVEAPELVFVCVFHREHDDRRADPASTRLTENLEAVLLRQLHV